MKTFFATLTIIILSGFLASAQTGGKPFTTNTYLNGQVRRNVRFNFITKDSVNLALNQDFELIEDSCSQVIRYGHLNMSKRKFFGHFTDVSKLDPTLILTEGNYNDDGLKDGPFISRYLNGQLQAEGNFKNNAFDGHWELFYDNGKPKLTFDANGSDISITGAWDDKGTATVINGKGTYRVDLGPLYWKGKLLNGKPDGTWRAAKTDDATETDVLTESYKNGAFKKGNGPIGDYTDAPHLVLVAPDRLLPFTRTETLRISAVPCNGVKRKHLVNAQYRNGLNSFNEEIKEVITPYISKVNIASYQNTLVLEGEINTSGVISNLQTHSPFNDNLARGLINQLRRLPPLEPATADGVPIVQKFTISFVFDMGVYHFNYRFLPLTAQ